MLMHFLTRVSYHYPQLRVLPRGHRSRVWGVASDRLDRPGRGLPAAPPRSRRRLRARTGGFTPAPKRGCTPLARGFARSFWSPRLGPGLPPRLLRLRPVLQGISLQALQRTSPRCSVMQLPPQQPATPPSVLVFPAARLGDRLVHIITGTADTGNHHRISTPVDTGGTGMHSTPRGVYHLVVCSR
jgi:hypothetical protein